MSSHCLLRYPSRQKWERISSSSDREHRSPGGGVSGTTLVLSSFLLLRDAFICHPDLFPVTELIRVAYRVGIFWSVSVGTSR